MRHTQFYERPLPLQGLEGVDMDPMDSRENQAAHAFFIYDNGDKNTEKSIEEMTRYHAVDGVKIGKICCSGYGNFSEARKKQAVLESLREKVRSGEIGKNTIIFIPLHTHLDKEEHLKFSLEGSKVSLRIPTKEIYDCIWSMFPGNQKPSFHNLGCNSGYQSEELISADGYVLNYAGKSTIGATEGLNQANEVLKFVSTQIKNGKAMPAPTEVWQHMEHYALQEMSITGNQSLAAHNPFMPAPTDSNRSDRPNAGHQNPMMLIKYAFRHKPFDEVMGLIDAYDPQCASLRGLDETAKTRLLYSVLHTNVNWDIYDEDAIDSDSIFNFLSYRDTEQKFIFLKESGILPKLNTCAVGDKFLMEACKSGNARMVRRFLESPDFPLSEAGINFALGKAIELGDTSLTSVLLEHVSGIQINDEEGNSVLQIACLQKDIRIMAQLTSEAYGKKLLQEHIDLLPPSTTPAEVLKSFVNQRNKYGQSALGQTIRNNHLDAVRMLLEAGADPNAADGNGERVIHRAVERGNADIVRLLLAYGAQASEPDSRGNSLLCTALWKSHDAVAEILISHYREMHDSQSINAKNRLGSTPLLLAIKKKNTKMIEALLSAGASTLIQDTSRQGLLHWFFKRFNERTTGKTSTGDTSASSSWNNEKTSFAIALVRCGAPADLIDPKGNTALHAAAKTGDTNLIKYMAGLDIDLNARNRKGYTALHYVLEKGLHNASRFLINKGTDLSLPTFDIDKALELAVAANDSYAINQLQLAASKRASANTHAQSS